MNFVQRMDAWSERQQVKWVLLLRIALGLLLWYKGFSFISHTNELEAMIAGSQFKDQAHWLAMYVTWAQFFGGVMILIGLVTRVAVVIQLPVLIGAVFFINAAHGILHADPQFWLSVIALLMLLFFLVEGGGPYSMDRYVKRKLL